MISLEARGNGGVLIGASHLRRQEGQREPELHLIVTLD
jgi:hypothetical protein